MHLLFWVGVGVVVTLGSVALAALVICAEESEAKQEEKQREGNDH